MGDNLMRREQLRAYTANWSLKVKVLDFIKSGGPDWTRTRKQVPNLDSLAKTRFEEVPAI